MAQVAQKLVSSITTKGPVLINKTVAFAQPRLSTFWRYAKVELTPPSFGDMPAVQKGFQNLVQSAKTGKYRNLTVKEATVNTLVGIEIAMWFFIGEVIGKGTLVGYQIPGAVNFDAGV